VLQQASTFAALMATTGFSQVDMQSPQNVEIAYHLSHEGGGSFNLPEIATAFRTIGANEVQAHPEFVTTIRSMSDNGWKNNDINRPAIYSAHALIRAGYSPNPNTVNSVWRNSAWYPSPNGVIPPEVLDGIDRGDRGGRGS
jgi:hypothetical protein